jgi:hypothetical protein
MLILQQKFLTEGRQTRSVHYSVEEAFNLATIYGARAAKMAEKTGSIAEGKVADITIFSATSPCMLAAAQHDPIAAVILHSSPGDVEIVIVDGVVRKKNGKLVPVQVDEKAQRTAGKSSLEWSDVVEEILRRQKVMDGKIQGVDLDDALDRLIDVWHVDRSAALADNV